ncbi:PREDICTED: uncharacterized protein LOC101297829 [Fragaria vesca subsp. vesca]
MRVNLSLDEDWDPDNWLCESCEEGNGMLFPNSRIQEDTLESLNDRSRYDTMHLAGASTSNCSGWQAHSKRQKSVVSEKVKFITNEEVRRLSSADQPQMTPVGYKTVTPKSPGSGVKVNPRFIRSEVAMPHRRSRPPKMQNISKINQQAQPPCTVHRKAYEFSRKMPPVLRANLLPRLLLWADPFQEECPDLQDVGLYFFPDDNIAGSRETYALLFEVMDTQNSVMRIFFDGVDAVDLLIFTSTQLHFYSPSGKMVGTVDVVFRKTRPPLIESLSWKHYNNF